MDAVEAPPTSNVTAANRSAPSAVDSRHFSGSGGAGGTAQLC